MKQKISVLVAEDNPADVLLIEDAVAAHGLPLELLIVNDGEQAVRLIEEAERNPLAPCPEMLLPDLNLPRRSGIEVLQRVRESEPCRHIPVVILTSSDSPRDRAETARLGANCYFRKPSNYDEFLKIGEVVRDLLGGIERPHA